MKAKNILNVQDKLSPENDPTNFIPGSELEPSYYSLVSNFTTFFGNENLGLNCSCFKFVIKLDQAKQIQCRSFTLRYYSCGSA